MSYAKEFRPHPKGRQNRCWFTHLTGPETETHKA